MRKNRLNDLDSKTYMKFLKSWCLEDDTSEKDFVSFFTKQKADDGISTKIACWGFPDHQKTNLFSSKRIIIDLREEAGQPDFSYALINLTDQIFSSEKQILEFFISILKPILLKLKTTLKQNAYITILVDNTVNRDLFYPSAWMIGKLVSQFFAMKDEKLICREINDAKLKFFSIHGKKITYALNFRNEKENKYSKIKTDYFKSSLKQNILPEWFILKPPPRNEKVKLHPAKFPEILISKLIASYTKPGDCVFDPMSGTGSSQVAALESGRKACGFEITKHFYDIALDRLKNITPDKDNYMLINNDIFAFEKYTELPGTFDYIVTSPPYWDMLNMKGAETQKSRRENGLHVNYSEMENDIGNCQNYDEFLETLLRIYIKIITRLRKGGHFTIIIKNIKKKGTIYTFAWDLAEHLSKQLRLVNMQFWLQDDIKIAPYGWGSAWASNTFHQYILTFRKNV